jgi:hypothetical protein
VKRLPVKRSEISDTSGPDVKAISRIPCYADLVTFTEARIPGNPLGFKVFVTFGEHKRKNAVSVTFVKTERWIEVRVRVKKGLVYPHPAFIKTRSVSINDRTAQILMGQRFVYEGEEVYFRNCQEAAAFGAGNGLFWVLRNLKRIKGRLAQTTRNVHGLLWLEDYRWWVKSEKNLSVIMPEVLVGKPGGVHA